MCGISITFTHNDKTNEGENEMKIKEMFKKLETYNEIADLMYAQKAKIQFKYIKHEEISVDCHGCISHRIM